HVSDSYCFPTDRSPTFSFFFFQAEDGIRDRNVTGVQTCALPISQPVQDLANADCIIIQGSNMAECHPVGFQWVTEANARGARIIHVDPRFTRNTAIAEKHVAIRAGSDIVLLCALINRVLTEGEHVVEDVRAYTNAANLISTDYHDTEDLGELFSGFDPDTNSYDNSTWSYQTDEHGAPATDPSLEDPNTVFQILKRHYSRYTP